MSDTSPSPFASRLIAEGIGTLLLVVGMIGTALFASHYADEAGALAPGVVYLAVSLAIGLAVFVGASAFAGVSGAHFNPAVTLGLAAAGRFAWADTWKYIAAQVVGGAIGSTLLVLVGLFGPSNWLKLAQDGGFASNGWGSASPGGFGMPAAIIVEVLFTAIFVIAILGITHPGRESPNAPLAIGLTLTLIHLATIAVDNTSVNPARSIATALYGGGTAIAQLWVFIVFPIVGALLAGFAYRALFPTTARP
ncbi:MAG: aquaporin [Microbacterium sp.]